MNSMHTDSSDEFEKQLSSLSLIEPSGEYRNLASTLDALPKSASHESEKSLFGYAMVFAFTFVAVVGVAFVMWGEMPANSDQSMSEQTASAESPVLYTSAVEPPLFIVGTHYQDLGTSHLVGAQPFSEIKEFFAYPCFPCFEFDQILRRSERAAASESKVVYVPAVWSEEMRYYAQVFYTAENLGVQESSHRLLFEALHEEDLKLTDLSILTRFFGLFGVSEQQFLTAFNSRATLDRVRDAEQANQEYKIQSVPALVVDCRYLVTPNSSVEQQQMLDVAQYLIDNRNEEAEKLC